ncbi:MAG: hypothetical protein AB9903_00575 [Vulcanimicrobiota bacterium]
MKDLLANLFLAGFGAVMLTKEKARSPRRKSKINAAGIIDFQENHIHSDSRKGLDCG